MKRSQVADASAIYTMSSRPCSGKCPDKADDMDRILDRFGHVQEEYEHLGGYALESQAREVLHGLGFNCSGVCAMRT
jgi:ATPase subunit of ABC transporter with duplicated ATPase domains